MENKTIDIRYLGILPDVLFFDEQAPAYLVMTEESDRLLLSRVVHLDAVEKAFHELSGAFLVQVETFTYTADGSLVCMVM